MDANVVILYMEVIIFIWHCDQFDSGHSTYWNGDWYFLHEIKIYLLEQWYITFDLFLFDNNNNASYIDDIRDIPASLIYIANLHTRMQFIYKYRSTYMPTLLSLTHCAVKGLHSDYCYLSCKLLLLRFTDVLSSSSSSLWMHIS